MAITLAAVIGHWFVITAGLLAPCVGGALITTLWSLASRRVGDQSLGVAGSPRRARGAAALITLLWPLTCGEHVVVAAFVGVSTTTGSVSRR